MSAPQPSAIEERRRLRRAAPAALRDLGERRQHRHPRRRDRDGRHADRDLARERPGARRADAAHGRADARVRRVRRRRAGGRQRRRAVHHRDGDDVVRERRDGDESRRRLQRAAPRHRRHVRGGLPPSRQVRRRGRSRSGRIPEPRTRGAADGLAARLLHLARAGARRRRDFGAGRRHQRRLVEHRARDARSPRRVDRLGHQAPDLGRCVRLRVRRGAVERPRPPRVGRLQARQDEPPGRDIR